MTVRGGGLDGGGGRQGPDRHLKGMGNGRM